MARKKPVLSLRRPTDAVDPLQADRFVRGLMSDPPDAEPSVLPIVKTSERPVASTAPTHLVTSERPNVQASEAQVPARPAGSASKSLVYRKRTDDVRRRMTVYLSEDLSRRLRLYAAEQDQDYSVVLAEALGALLDQRGVH